MRGYGITKWFPNTINKINSKTVLTDKDGNRYDIYSDNKGKYYYELNGKYEEITNKNVLQDILDDREIDYTTEQATKVDPPAPIFKDPSGTKVPEEPKKETTKPTTSGSTSTGVPSYTAPSPSKREQLLESQLNDYKAELDALKEQLKPRSAQEMAKIYGVDYNLDNILADYNKQTNEYYNDAIAKQTEYRNDFARDNALFYDKLINEYLDSYKNTAATNTNKGIRTANALSNAINANNVNAANDYGMLQSINNLGEAKKAELANNPYLAEQQYNKLGTYLSNLSANINTSDVKQYVDSLDAYSNLYSGSRQYQNYLAQAAQSKYSGLANAAKYNASATGDSSLAKIYENYFNLTRGNRKDAANAFVNTINPTYK